MVERVTIRGHRIASSASFPERFYVYRGTVTTEQDPEAGRTLKPCGTTAAARRHYLNGEKPCDACRDAEREKWRESKRKKVDKPKAKGFTQEKCGTNAGHQRHTYYGVPPCDACMVAHRAYQQARRDRLRAAKGKKSP